MINVSVRSLISIYQSGLEESYSDVSEGKHSRLVQRSGAKSFRACLAGLHRRERFGRVAKSADYTCGVHSSANANLDIFSSLLHHDTCEPLRIFLGMWNMSTLWYREVFQQSTDKASVSVPPHAWIYRVFF